MREPKTSEVFALSSRCPLEPGEIKQLLIDLGYEDETFGSKTEVTEVIIFLSTRGFLPPGIIQTIDIAFAKFDTLTEIMRDPMFNEMSVVGSNKFDIKIDLKRPKALPNSQLKFCPFVFRGRECGYKGNDVFCAKHFRACKEHGNEERFGGFRPNPPQIPKIPIPRVKSLFPENDDYIEEIEELKSSKDKAIQERLRQISMSMEESFLTGSSYSSILANSKIIDRGMKMFETTAKGELETKAKALEDRFIGRTTEFNFFPNPKIIIKGLDEPRVDPEEYGKGEPSATFKWKPFEQLECPSGFPQSEWDSIPTTTKKMILKRLGYNKEKENDNKDINRAIDL